MSNETDPFLLPPFPANPTWNWKTPTEWRKSAVAAQNDFYIKNNGVMFNKLMNYEAIENEILNKAFSTNPKTVRTLSSSMNMWYKKPERKIAIKLRTMIQARTKTEEVYMNAVFVMSYLKEDVATAVPVFYFKTGDTVLYIDLCARVYTSWKHFLQTNTIDPSLCCYPLHGHYGQNQENENPNFNDQIPLLLEIDESPSCGIVATGTQWVNTVFTYTTYIVMGASIVLGVGSLFTDAKYVMQLNALAQKTNKYLQYTNSAAAVAFSIVNIHDKLQHGSDYQDIVAEVSLIVSNLVNFLTPVIQKKIITEGLSGKDLAEAGFGDLSPMAKLFLNIMAISRCATACISVVSCIGAMIMKYMYGGTITTIDYFNLASSLYTCYGVMTSPLTAKKIFEEVQQEHKKEIARNQVEKKKEERERLEAEIEERYKDDEEAKAGIKYYKTNILGTLDADDYVVNDQLIRLIKAADDPKELFCELAFTNTTVEIKRGILLINGQLNIDGAAFSKHTNHGSTDVGTRLLKKIQAENDGVLYVETGQKTSNREKILQTTAGINGQATPLTPKEIQQNSKLLLKKTYHWTLEVEVDEFEQFLAVNGIALQNNLTISQYNRLIQIYNDGNHQPEKWRLVKELSDRLGCDNPHAIAGLTEIVNGKVDEEFLRSGTTLKTNFKCNKMVDLLNGLNSQDAIDFVNSINERIQYFEEKYANGDPTLANFNETAAAAGPKAAAFEAYGHGCKKYHRDVAKTHMPHPDKNTWIDDYLSRGTRGTPVLSQDGLFWRSQPAPYVAPVPAPVTVTTTSSTTSSLQ